MTRGARNLVLLHLPANALLLWLAYKWLGVDESSGAKLLWSAVDALVILALACWLYGATIVFFRMPGERRINEAFRAALPHVAVLLLFALAVVALYLLIGRWAAASDEPPFRVASWLTMKLRKPVKPETVGSVYHAGFWLLRWMILPVLLLPLVAGLAVKGPHGWREVIRRRSWREWILVPILLVIGLWLPIVLVGWTPKVEGFGMEMASFVLRSAMAYLLFVGALIKLASHLGHAGLQPGDHQR
jgi:hypothetical protein